MTKTRIKADSRQTVDSCVVPQKQKNSFLCIDAVHSGICTSVSEPLLANFFLLANILRSTALRVSHPMFCWLALKCFASPSNDDDDDCEEEEDDVDDKNKLS